MKENVDKYCKRKSKVALTSFSERFQILVVMLSILEWHEHFNILPDHFSVGVAEHLEQGLITADNLPHVVDANLTLTFIVSNEMNDSSESNSLNSKR
jgi:hypothetical protein